MEKPVTNKEPVANTSDQHLSHSSSASADELAFPSTTDFCIPSLTTVNIKADLHSTIENVSPVSSADDHIPKPSASSCDSSDLKINIISAPGPSFQKPPVVAESAVCSDSEHQTESQELSDKVEPTRKGSKDGEHFQTLESFLKFRVEKKDEIKAHSKQANNVLTSERELDISSENDVHSLDKELLDWERAVVRLKSSLDASLVLSEDSQPKLVTTHGTGRNVKSPTNIEKENQNSIQRVYLDSLNQQLDLETLSDILDQSINYLKTIQRNIVEDEASVVSKNLAKEVSKQCRTKDKLLMGQDETLEKLSRNRFPFRDKITKKDQDKNLVKKEMSAQDTPVDCNKMDVDYFSLSLIKSVAAGVNTKKENQESKNTLPKEIIFSDTCVKKSDGQNFGKALADLGFSFGSQKEDKANIQGAPFTGTSDNFLGLSSKIKGVSVDNSDHNAFIASFGSVVQAKEKVQEKNKDSEAAKKGTIQDEKRQLESVEGNAFQTGGVDFAPKDPSSDEKHTDEQDKTGNLALHPHRGLFSFNFGTDSDALKPREKFSFNLENLSAPKNSSEKTEERTKPESRESLFSFGFSKTNTFKHANESSSFSIFGMQSDKEKTFSGDLKNEIDHKEQSYGGSKAHGNTFSFASTFDSSMKKFASSEKPFLKDIFGLKLDETANKDKFDGLVSTKPGFSASFPEIGKATVEKNNLGTTSDKLGIFSEPLAFDKTEENAKIKVSGETNSVIPFSFRPPLPEKVSDKVNFGSTFSFASPPQEKVSGEPIFGSPFFFRTPSSIVDSKTNIGGQTFGRLPSSENDDKSQIGGLTSSRAPSRENADSKSSLGSIFPFATPNEILMGKTKSEGPTPIGEFASHVNGKSSKNVDAESDFASAALVGAACNKDKSTNVHFSKPVSFGMPSSITVNDIAGSGSSFSFSIPTKKDTDDKAPPASKNAGSNSSSGSTILFGTPCKYVKDKRSSESPFSTGTSSNGEGDKKKIGKLFSFEAHSSKDVDVESDYGNAVLVAAACNKDKGANGSSISPASFGTSSSKNGDNKSGSGGLFSFGDSPKKDVGDKVSVAFNFSFEPPSNENRCGFSFKRLSENFEKASLGDSSGLSSNKTANDSSNGSSFLFGTSSKDEGGKASKFSFTPPSEIDKERFSNSVSFTASSNENVCSQVGFGSEFSFTPPSEIDKEIFSDSISFSASANANVSSQASSESPTSIGESSNTVGDKKNVGNLSSFGAHSSKDVDVESDYGNAVLVAATCNKDKGASGSSVSPSLFGTSFSKNGDNKSGSGGLFSFGVPLKEDVGDKANVRFNFSFEPPPNENRCIFSFKPPSENVEKASLDSGTSNTKVKDSSSGSSFVFGISSKNEDGKASFGNELSFVPPAKIDNQIFNNIVSFSASPYEKVCSQSGFKSGVSFGVFNENASDKLTFGSTLDITTPGLKLNSSNTPMKNDNKHDIAKLDFEGLCSVGSSAKDAKLTVEKNKNPCDNFIFGKKLYDEKKKDNEVAYVGKNREMSDAMFRDGKSSLDNGEDKPKIVKASSSFASKINSTGTEGTSQYLGEDTARGSKMSNDENKLTKLGEILPLSREFDVKCTVEKCTSSASPTGNTLEFDLTNCEKTASPPRALVTDRICTKDSTCKTDFLLPQESKRETGEKEHQLNSGSSSKDDANKAGLLVPPGAKNSKDMELPLSYNPVNYISTKADLTESYLTSEKLGAKQPIKELVPSVDLEQKLDTKKKGTGKSKTLKGAASSSRTEEKPLDTVSDDHSTTTDEGSKTQPCKQSALFEEFLRITYDDNFGSSSQERIREERSSKLGDGEAPRQQDPTAQCEGRSLTLKLLVKIISFYPNFSTQISNLKKLNGLDPMSVLHLASTNHHMFQMSGETLSLKPQLTLCPEHLSPKGCQCPSECKNLHVCPKYIRYICRDKGCSLGHVWHTDHNRFLLEKYGIETLSPMKLNGLFFHLGKPSGSRKQVSVCQDYNSQTCSKLNCNDLHICSSFVAGVASCCIKNCSLNHDILNFECRNILKLSGISTNQTALDIIVTLLKANPSLCERPKLPFKNTVDLKSHNTLWSHYLEGDVHFPEICFYSVEKQCKNESSCCPRLHASHHFHWQVKDQSKHWLNLRSPQVLSLERSYCDVNQDGVNLPRLDPSAVDISVNGLLTLLGRDIWHADFDTLTLTNSSKNTTLNIRRLCTEDVDGKVIRASTFVWYFLDKNQTWVKYGNTDTQSKSKSCISSESIEKHYKKNLGRPIDFKTSQFKYTLDFKKMVQMNMSTQMTRKVRRRPMCHLDKERKGMLPLSWDAMPTGERLLRVALSSSSPEYQKVIGLLKGRISDSQVKKIERVQNLFLWHALENKIRELTTIYGSLLMVDVRQLFHGTNHNVVQAICCENFDWRLHGSNVGQAYGQGTYFSTDAKYSYDYCRADDKGLKYMFIARVIVGTVITGNSSMTRPPQNSDTGLPHDSTVDKVPDFKILVKYDKQEYYPEYLLTLS